MPNKIVDIIAVEVRPPHLLLVRFEDGVAGVVDVAKLVDFRGVFSPLRNPERFAEAYLNRELGTVCWPNGADLDPLVLYERVVDSQRP